MCDAVDIDLLQKFFAGHSHFDYRLTFSRRLVRLMVAVLGLAIFNLRLEGGFYSLCTTLLRKMPVDLR